MNKQIQLLEKQAFDEIWDSDNDPIGPGTQFVPLGFIEKFAELIVKDCLKQIDKMRDGFEADKEDQQALGTEWAGLAVARYFGVEE